MNNLPRKKFATKHLFHDDTMHVSAFKLDVIVTTSGISKAIGVSKRSPSLLFIGIKKSRIMAVDKPKRFTFFLASR